MGKGSLASFFILLSLAILVNSASANEIRVQWKEAIEILSGKPVYGVTQLHDLTVYLYLSNGTSYITREPKIDAIYFEIEKCGKPCKDIVIETE